MTLVMPIEKYLQREMRVYYIELGSLSSFPALLETFLLLDPQCIRTLYCYLVLKCFQIPVENTKPFVIKAVTFFDIYKYIYLF